MQPMLPIPAEIGLSTQVSNTHTVIAAPRQNDMGMEMDAAVYKHDAGILNPRCLMMSCGAVAGAATALLSARASTSPTSVERCMEITTKQGIVRKVAGPVVTADDMDGAAMYELVVVGPLKRMGEIIRLSASSATIQMYEETAGLRVGDPVNRLKQPFSVELGPGMLGGPSHVLAQSDGVDVCGGVDVPRLPRLDHEILWGFTPEVSPGDVVYPGDVVGRVDEKGFKHLIMVPPNIGGIVTEIHPEGECTIDAVVAKVKWQGGSFSVKLFQKWPIRQPRPFSEVLRSQEPLLTGQRVLDALFPSVLGGTIALPGPIGNGRTVISQALKKCSNVDCLVYVGSEEPELLMGFDEEQFRTGEREDYRPIPPTSVVCSQNTSIAFSEASIYTGVTIAEYFRDMGYNVMMLWDSAPRWAEGLREISGRLAEMPTDSGWYPEILAARLASLYERAGLVTCSGGFNGKALQGSITLAGAVSPAGGNFSDPVTSATLGIVQVFWGLDNKLERKHDLSVNWLISYSNYGKALESFYETNYPEFISLQRTMREILQKEYELMGEIVQLVGKDGLPERDKVTLKTAKIIREDYLAQNSFTTYDRWCPMWKTVLMARNIVHFYTCANTSIESTATSFMKITFNMIQDKMDKLLNKLSSMKFLEPPETRDELQALIQYFDDLRDEVTDAFRRLEKAN